MQDSSEKNTAPPVDGDNAADKVADKVVNPGDGMPKFGRLLLVLLAAVLVMVVITFVSEALYS